MNFIPIPSSNQALISVAYPNQTAAFSKTRTTVAVNQFSVSAIKAPNVGNDWTILGRYSPDNHYMIFFFYRYATVAEND